MFYLILKEYNILSKILLTFIHYLSQNEKSIISLFITE